VVEKTRSLTDPEVDLGAGVEVNLQPRLRASLLARPLAAPFGNLDILIFHPEQHSEQGDRHGQA
jgi:hypothetical protein